MKTASRCFPKVDAFDRSIFNVTPSVKGRPQYSQSICRFLSYLIDMGRPGVPFIKGHTKITGGIDLLD